MYIEYERPWIPVWSVVQLNGGGNRLVEGSGSNHYCFSSKIVTCLIGGGVCSSNVTISFLTFYGILRL